MTEDDLNALAADNSSSMTYTFTISIQTGRLSGQKRMMIARLLRKIISGFVQQMNVVAEGLFLVELEVVSPQQGVRQIDIGADE